MLVETERAVKQASDIVQKLLTYSRQESQTEFRPLFIEPILGNVEAVSRETFERRIAVDIELGATLPQVSGDPKQLEQMLLNLRLKARDALQAVK